MLTDSRTILIFQNGKTLASFGTFDSFLAGQKSSVAFNLLAHAHAFTQLKEQQSMIRYVKKC